MPDYELRLNCGLVIRGPATAIADFIAELDRLLERHPALRVLVRDTTDQKLWLRRGEQGDAP